MDSGISKAWRPPRPYLTVGLEAFYHHIPLSLVLPQVPKELLLFTVILADPLQASLHEAKAVESLPRREP
jgi:hypothetical protein